jgi:hypothetical protein
MNISTNRLSSSERVTDRPSGQQQQRPMTMPTHRGVVQRSSIQNQFSSLTNDRDRFRKEKEQAEIENERVLAEYEQLKLVHQEFQTKNCQAQAELGACSKKLCLLTQEEARMGKQLANDVKVIEHCTKDLKSMEAKKDEIDTNFVSRMDPINMEVGIYLQKRIEKGIGQRITTRTVETVILPFLEAKTKEGDPALANGIFGLHESIEALKQATAMQEQAEKELQHLIEDLEEKGVDVDALFQDEGNKDNHPSCQEAEGQKLSAENLFYGHDDMDGLEDNF